MLHKDKISASFYVVCILAMLLAGGN